VDSEGNASPYEFFTYCQVKEQAEAVASALAQCGVTKNGKVGVYSANKVEWMLTVRAADILAATIVPIYDSLGEDAIEYIIEHSGEENFVGHLPCIFIFLFLQRRQR